LCDLGLHMPALLSRLARAPPPVTCPGAPRPAQGACHRRSCRGPPRSPARHSPAGRAARLRRGGSAPRARPVTQSGPSRGLAPPARTRHAAALTHAPGHGQAGGGGGRAGGRRVRGARAGQARARRRPGAPAGCGAPRCRPQCLVLPLSARGALGRPRGFQRAGQPRLSGALVQRSARRGHAGRPLPGRSRLGRGCCDVRRRAGADRRVQRPCMGATRPGS